MSELDPTANDSLSQLKEKGGQIRQQAGEMAGLVGSMAGQQYSKLKQGAAALGRAGLDRAAHLRDSTADHVRHHPMRSLMIAIGLGALVGVLLTRRR